MIKLFKKLIGSKRDVNFNQIENQLIQSNEKMLQMAKSRM